MEKKEELLNDQIGNTLQNKTEELVKREKVNGTPFEIITAEGKNFVALGKYRVTDDTQTVEELKEKIFNLDYDFLINMVFVLIEITDKAKAEELVNN